MRVGFPVVARASGGEQLRGRAKGPSWRRGGVAEEHRGSTATCQRARLVLRDSVRDVSFPVRVPGVGQSASVAMFGTLLRADQQSSHQSGYSAPSHQPWSTETRPAGRKALARCHLPLLTRSKSSTKKASFSRAPFPERDGLPDVSLSGARVPSACPISFHITSHPGLELVFVQTKKQGCFPTGTLFSCPPFRRFLVVSDVSIGDMSASVGDHCNRALCWRKQSWRC